MVDLSRAPTRTGGSPCTDMFRTYDGSNDMPTYSTTFQALERTDSALQHLRLYVMFSNVTAVQKQGFKLFAVVYCDKSVGEGR